MFSGRLPCLQDSSEGRHAAQVCLTDIGSGFLQQLDSTHWPTTQRTAGNNNQQATGINSSTLEESLAMYVRGNLFIYFIHNVVMGYTPRTHHCEKSTCALCAIYFHVMMCPSESRSDG